MAVYYNEIDPHAAAWLQALMDADAIRRGDIDTRSIEDVTPNDLHGYTQCHFFAGIGGWVHALDLAGWPRSRPVWTGSCPCQPFSAAGKGAGFEDERHLWPAWQHLIAQCRPAVVFGEQVASKRADAWIDLVHADMEGMGYAFGCVPFPAAAVGTQATGERAMFVAEANRGGLSRDTQSHERTEARQPAPRWGNTGGCRADAFSSARTVVGADGKRRRLEPGIEPLAHGLPARVGRLRGYGNAIVPQQAAAFVSAYLAATGAEIQEAA